MWFRRCRCKCKCETEPKPDLLPLLETASRLRDDLSSGINELNMFAQGFDRLL